MLDERFDVSDVGANDEPCLLERATKQLDGHVVMSMSAVTRTAPAATTATTA